MASIVMRVRLTSGDHTDVTFTDDGARNEAEAIEAAVTALSSESGVLRCSHGDREIVLFARGVTSIEVAPRGAIL